MNLVSKKSIHPQNSKNYYRIKIWRGRRMDGSNRLEPGNKDLGPIEDTERKKNREERVNLSPSYHLDILSCRREPLSVVLVEAHLRESKLDELRRARRPR